VVAVERQAGDAGREFVGGGEKDPDAA